MKVMIAASEAKPFVKSGGLGDVMGSLPLALKQEEVSVSVILPKYAGIRPEYVKNMKRLDFFEVELGWRKLYCGILKLELEGIDYYFVDNEYFFKRPELYGYDDDCERFAFFSKAVLLFAERLGEDCPRVIQIGRAHV